MKDRALLKILSVALALFSLVICLFIWGQLSGFEKGYLDGILYSNKPHTDSLFSLFGPSIYERINNWYFIITFGFCFYIIGKYLKPLMVSSIVCVLSLSIALYPFWDMLEHKNSIIKITSHYRDNYWLNSSIYFDWFLLLTAIILIFIQFSLIITRRIDNETFKIT